jgi:ElaB/YqjD/DUF883 family membrane-anchored ribosome-binding protein
MVNDMSENVERFVNTGVTKAENVKSSTAEALEEAARKIRQADLAGKGDEIKAILADLEAKTAHLKEAVDEKVEPAETFIKDHPFVSVAMAVGVGFLIGALIRRD